jgi:uncharacterized protein YbaR (Trm112 family)
MKEIDHLYKEDNFRLKEADRRYLIEEDNLRLKEEDRRYLIEEGKHVTPLQHEGNLRLIEEDRLHLKEEGHLLEEYHQREKHHLFQIEEGIPLLLLRRNLQRKEEDVLLLLLIPHRRYLLLLEVHLLEVILDVLLLPKEHVSPHHQHARDRRHNNDECHLREEEPRLRLDEILEDNSLQIVEGIRLIEYEKR